MGKVAWYKISTKIPRNPDEKMRVDGLTDDCCRTQLQVCSCCSIDEDDGSFPSILTCEGEEVVYRGRLGVARDAVLLLPVSSSVKRELLFTPIVVVVFLDFYCWKRDGSGQREN
ncbi:hypothetical protein KY284_010242 [Solanum tuberosum]|nr:hypothetical protein KY284_010242 [Solanum tuberosum]